MGFVSIHRSASPSSVKLQGIYIAAQVIFNHFRNPDLIFYLVCSGTVKEYSYMRIRSCDFMR